MVSLVSVVIGLIKPSLLRISSRKRAFLITSGSTILFFILFGITVPTLPKENNVLNLSGASVSTSTPVTKTQETREVTYLNQKSFKFLCSKDEGKGYVTDYYEVGTAKMRDHLLLKNKITDLTIYISKVTSVGGWNTESLCGKDFLDLPQRDWEMLIPGKDCGAGALIEPCDLDTVSDSKGVTEFIFGPEINGYISETINSLFKKGVLIKVNGKLL